MARVACRPPPAGGCISFLKYWRFTSNRLREYGPFDRFIDKAKLTATLTYEDLVADRRYAIALKVPVLGVMEARRYAFEDQIFPFKGLDCPPPPTTTTA